MMAIAALAFAAIPATADVPRRPEAPVRVEVTAAPITSFELRDTTRVRFGALAFRGGLVLSSSDPNFGGISGFRVADDGRRFLAVTDKGRWLAGRIVYDGTRPAGVADAEMAPLLGADGKPLAARGWYDAESLTAADGVVHVGIERVHRIVRFDVGRHGLKAPGQPIVLPPGIGRLPSNKGVEALVAVPKGLPLGGSLIALSERGLDADGNILGFVLGGPQAGAFSVRRSDDYDVSDAALTPDGDLLVLERRYSLLRGVAMRMRRMPLAAVRPGAVVDGPVLIEADMGFQIDNMEALSVHRGPDGETVLTIVSDDNFSPLQRTVLLQFTLEAD